jgi:dephospho-CoA kinase
MRIIGLTGGIGSGKSAVARFIAELGAEVLDLDKVGHSILRIGSPAYKKVVREFGDVILDKDREINRTKLGNLVFSNPTALKRLNNITHPEIDKIVANQINVFRRRGVKVVLLEAAAMVEASKANLADELWVILAPEKTVLERLKGRPGYSMAIAKSRIRAQITSDERIKHARVVINNDGTLDELKAKVKAEWGKLLKRL